MVQGERQMKSAPVRGLAIAIVVMCTGILCSPALAVPLTFHASPSGSGTTCTSAAPCSLATAFANAVADDTIAVGTGTYSGLGPIPVGAGIHVVGGDPRPVLQFTGAGMTINGTGTHLALESPGGVPLAVASSGVGDDILARASSAATGCSLGDAGALRNSVCRSTGGAGATLSGNGTGLNVTAVGPDAGVAVDPASGTTHVFLTNSIVRALPSGNPDIKLLANPGANIVTLDIDHSNYATTSGSFDFLGGPANQTTAPAFVDAPHGDFHQIAASPTIDHGATATGVDIDGDPRSAGAGTDIGADEYVAPEVTTGAASALGETTATLNATVNPHGPNGSVLLQYGTSEAYGATADGGVVAGNSAQAIAATVAGLTPATTYHYRVSVTIGDQTFTGADQTFATSAPAPVPADGAAPPPLSVGAPAPANASTRGTPSIRQGVGVTVACPGSCAFTVSIVLSAKLAKRYGLSGKDRVLGSVRGTLLKAGSKNVKIKLSAKARRKLRRVRRLVANLQLTVKDAAGHTTRKTKRLTLRP